MISKSKDAIYKAEHLEGRWWLRIQTEDGTIYLDDKQMKQLYKLLVKAYTQEAKRNE
jgi:hypothetical protein